jgi:hypothetical protein
MRHREQVFTVIGFILVTIGVVFSLLWWDSVMVIAQGLVGIIVILTGALFIGLSRD